MADPSLTASSLAYTENFIAEDEVLLAARGRAQELGCTPVGPASGATLRLLAALVGARSVVEVGGGAGVSALWLLSGMRADGVLTSVDTEAEHQRAARTALSDAGVSSSRFRLINGGGSEVLPRLTDGAYDMVFIDADKTAYSDYFEQGVRLLRRGGVLAFDNVLWRDRVADPSVRDAETVALRELGRTVRDDARLITALLPVGDGLLVATKR
jgi:predicted O-methyltransferase YrrM